MSKDGNGSVSGWVSTGFMSSAFGYENDFSPTVFGFGLRKKSGLVFQL